MAIDTTLIAGEETLSGTIVNGSLSTTGVSVDVQFRDTKTGAARTPQATTLLFTIDKDNDRFEIIQADSHSTSSGVTTITINASGRAMPLFGTGGGGATGNTHDIGASVGSVVLARPLNELAARAVAKAGDTMTGELNFSGATNTGLRVNNLTTAERTALSPSAGTIVYDTDIGELYQYIGGAWSAVSAGSTQPNASTTVAGKVEEGTLAEQGSQTATGATGAKLFMSPVNTAKTSAGAGDENKIPLLNASGQLADGFVNSINTITAPAGEAVDGSSTPQLVYISDGTGGRTAGRFYKADADDTTNMAMAPIGFITENASSVGTDYIVYGGTVGGFSGLTPGATYYSSTTAGGITATANSLNQRPIGICTTATSVAVDSFPRAVPTTGWGNTGTIAIGGTSVVTVNTGWKAKAVSLGLLLQAFDSGGGNGFSAHYSVIYDGTAWRGVLTGLVAGGATSISGVTSAPSTGPAGGANTSSITLSVAFNATTTVFTFTNAITAGSGSSVVGYNLGATILPY